MNNKTGLFCKHPIKGWLKGGVKLLYEGILAHIEGSISQNAAVQCVSLLVSK